MGGATKWLHSGVELLGKLNSGQYSLAVPSVVSQYAYMLSCTFCVSTCLCTCSACVCTCCHVHTCYSTCIVHVVMLWYMYCTCVYMLSFILLCMCVHVNNTLLLCMCIHVVIQYVHVCTCCHSI